MMNQTGQNAGSSIFSGIESAPQRGAHNIPYIKEGGYVVRIAECKYVTARNAQFAIIETEILASSYDPNNAQTFAANQTGTRAAIFIKRNDSFFPTLVQLIVAASGVDAYGVPRNVTNIVTQQEADAIFSSGQPLSGRVINIEAIDVPTKIGGTFTRMDFSYQVW